MRIRKSLLIVLLLSFGLTGCYTQLEYSQKAKRITDEKPVEGYSWNDESEERANLTEADSIYIAETYGAKVAPYREEESAEYTDEEYIPVEYKNYDVIEQYEACGCDPYKTYVIYGSYAPYSGYYGSSFHAGWYHNYRHYPYDYYNYAYYSPFYRWHWRHHFGFRYYHRGFGFAWHWGSPYYYYDPFFYDPFYYGFRSPIFYNSYYFNGSYADNVRSNKSDRRYGRRSIGTDRVRGRNSSSVRTRSGITRSKANTTRVRSRTTGVQRSRGTVQRTRSRGTIKRSRSNGNGSGNVRSRGNNNVKRDRGSNNRDQAVVIPRTGLRSGSHAVIPARVNRSEIESRIRQQRARQINYDRQQRSRRSFLGRFKSIFDTRSRSINSSSSRNTNRSFKIPSRSRSKFGRSSSRSRSSSGTKVRSRSRSSKSSGSRSRSSGSSSRKRSRGNN